MQRIFKQSDHYRSTALKGLYLTGLAAFLFFISGCDLLLTNWDDGNDSQQYRFQQPWNVTTVSAYDDIRWGNLTLIENKLDSAIIPTFWFNQKTTWPQKFSSIANSVMEKAKNPGLGIRSLHAQGITGKGVTVAIIDQNIFLDHPEFAGKVLKYETFGEAKKAGASMHGPAVLSLLVGTSTGTAPDATVYFAAADSWTQDAKTQADALRWIINENRQLPTDKKIRVVSLSAAPSGPGSPFTKNNSDWDSARIQAEQEGIIVLDCTRDHGKTAACYYKLLSPDSLDGCTLGYSGIVPTIDTNRIYIPTSLRTTAEEYQMGTFEYQYTGRGGLSWSVPYLTGVLALGWQIRPELTGEEMLSLAFSSAYYKNGGKIINPVAFIDSVQNYHR
jgi:subtilisin family serine protease